MFSQEQRDSAKVTRKEKMWGLSTWNYSGLSLVCFNSHTLIPQLPSCESKSSKGTPSVTLSEPHLPEITQLLLRWLDGERLPRVFERQKQRENLASCRGMEQTQNVPL